MKGQKDKSIKFKCAKCGEDVYATRMKKYRLCEWCTSNVRSNKKDKLEDYLMKGGK